MTGLAYNILKSPKDLKPHPLNKEIYGDETADPDLIESIKNKGILETLVIRDDDVILSGHRRWMAAKELKLDKVPCRSITFSDALDEEEALIEFNRQRKKTPEQIYNEVQHLRPIIKIRNEEKQKAAGEAGAEFGVLGGRPKKDEEKPLTEKSQQGVSRKKKGKKKKKRELTTLEEAAAKVGMSSNSLKKLEELKNAASSGDDVATDQWTLYNSGKVVLNTAYNAWKKALALEERREELARKAAEAKELPPSVTVLHGDFLTEYSKIGKESVDCIITDPPYVNGWLDNYEAFAIAAEYVLKPGGFLISYVGHIHLDQILAQMTPYLDFYWIACLKHAGTTKSVHSRSVQCGMKPILVLQKEPRTKPKRYFNDLIQGTGREKGAHEWQQGEEELRQIFEPFTDPGDTILDPFMGSGTVIAMGQKMGRKVIGFDIDPLNVEIVKGRVVSNG